MQVIKWTIYFNGILTNFNINFFLSYKYLCEMDNVVKCKNLEAMLTNVFCCNLIMKNMSNMCQIEKIELKNRYSISSAQTTSCEDNI